MSIPTGASYNRRPNAKCHWKHDEDELLSFLVRTFGPKKWDRIASYIPGRTGKSCRTRWLNQLDPNLNKGPFTAEENQRLIELQREHGNKWAVIARHFHSRTDNNVKNQYHVLQGMKRYVRAPASFPNAAPSAPLGEGSSGLSQSHSSPVGPVASQPTETGPTPAHGDIFFGSPILRRLGIDCFGNSVMAGSSSSSAMFEGSCPAPEPQGVVPKKNEFIDFLGVGKQTD